MKVHIVTSDLTGTGPVWMNIFWAHYNAISECVPTALLTTPDAATKEDGLSRWQKLGRRIRAQESQLPARAMEALDPAGPNILLVWALRHSDVARAASLFPVWDRFDVKILSIVDNLEPRYVSGKIRDRFDLITSFCGDLAADYTQATGQEAVHFPPHTDVLNFGQASDYRPFDLFVVGRRVSAIHTPLHLHFNAPEKETVSVDFVSRSGNFTYSGETEFRLLMAGYGRAKLAFCFEASEIDRFHDRSPLTERWVHAWAAGCNVIGTSPSGAGVAEAAGWPEAMIDLPHDPDAARDLVEGLLADEDGLKRRRSRNLEEALRRHDTRHRLARICDTFGLERPPGLVEGLERLAERADALARERE